MDTALNVTPLARRRTSDVANKPAWPDGVAPITGIDGQRYSPHPNGGGLVAETAYVAASVFVGPNARVSGRALVEGNVRLLDFSAVEDEAIVVGSCVLRHQARVGDRAILVGKVVLFNQALIRGDARLEGAVLIEHFADIGDNSKIMGSLRVS